MTNVPAAAFFWSPDGESLGLLVDGEGEGEVQWLVWRDGATTELASFAPPFSFVTGVLPFSGQYSESLNLWSPDSAALAFAGRIGTDDGIWVQPIEGEPVLVADGEWVAWSYE